MGNKKQIDGQKLIQTMKHVLVLLQESKNKYYSKR